MTPAIKQHLEHLVPLSPQYHEDAKIASFPGTCPKFIYHSLLFLFLAKPCTAILLAIQEEMRCLAAQGHPAAAPRTTHRDHHVEAPHHRAEMKDNQLSGLVELAMFDLGEMKPFADFLQNKDNSAC